ncbi:protein of unknown function (plasmid) [Caballeronia sp. S22]
MRCTPVFTIDRVRDPLFPSSLSDTIQQALQARMLTRREPRRGDRLHDAAAPVCLGEKRIRTFEAQHLLEVFDRRIEMTDAIERSACADVVHGAVCRKSGIAGED